MKIKRNALQWTYGVFFGVFGLSFNAQAWEETPVSHPLTALIEQAIKQDPQRLEFIAQSQMVLEMGMRNATLNDPKLKVGLGGLPMDSFQWDSDPMTSFSIGLMQQFEAGESLTFMRLQGQQQAAASLKRLSVRARELANEVTQIWLELGYQQQLHRLLTQKLKLMRENEQEIAARYAFGGGDAPSVLSAQMGIAQLEEKRQASTQQQARLLALLSEWLGQDWLAQTPSLPATHTLTWLPLERRLSSVMEDEAQLYALLNQHPMADVLSANLATNQTEIRLAEEAFKPKFGVEVMYGHRRANTMTGKPAPDLLSAFLTVDLPWPHYQRQNRNLAAAQYRFSATQSQKDALLMQMQAKTQALWRDRQAFLQRIEYYQAQLLPKSTERIQALEGGYQNNRNTLSEVLMAMMEDIDWQLTLLRLQTDLNKVNSQLAFFLDGFSYQSEALSELSSQFEEATP